MISFGTACDVPVDVSALPDTGGAAALNDQNSDLFNAVLGQMLGDGESDGDIDSDDAIELDVDGIDRDSATDLSELVNPMIVDGITPTVPTAPILWHFSLEGKLATPVAEQSLVDMQAAAASADDVRNTATPTGGAAFSVAGLEAEAGKSAEQLELLENAVAAPLNTEGAASTASNPKPDRHATTKADKPRSETKIDAQVVRPVPAIAIERAYAGSSDRESSKSFDRSNDQAPASRLQTIGQAAAATTFVVPADVRPAVAMPTSIVTLDANVPVVVDPAVEMQVPSQIVQSIRMQAIDGGGEAILRLRPEYLGELVVAVKVEQGSVTAALQADTPGVRQWVERNEAILRQGLAEHGLQLDRLTVSEKAGETENEGHPDHQQSREEPSRQQSRRRRQPAHDATFEVTV